MTEQNLDAQFGGYDFEIIESFIGSRRSTRLPLRLVEDMINILPHGYVITACHQKNNPIVFVNSSFEKITGYSSREVRGHNCLFLLGKDTRQEALGRFREAVRLKQQHTETVRNYRKDGSLFYNELTVVPVGDHLKNTKYLIWHQRDVTTEVEEKKELHDRITSNVEHILLPSLERISLNRGEETYIEHHRIALENLTSSFGTKVNGIRVKLTPREMEVCDLVKNGMVTKDIARILKIAPHTVEKHRRMARKKLGLANKGVNLHSYLNSL